MGCNGYALDELVTLARPKADSGCYYKSGRLFWKCVLLAVTEDLD